MCEAIAGLFLGGGVLGSERGGCWFDLLGSQVAICPLPPADMSPATCRYVPLQEPLAAEYTIPANWPGRVAHEPPPATPAPPIGARFSPLGVAAAEQAHRAAGPAVEDGPAPREEPPPTGPPTVGFFAPSSASGAPSLGPFGRGGEGMARGRGRGRSVITSSPPLPENPPLEELLPPRVAPLAPPLPLVVAEGGGRPRAPVLPSGGAEEEEGGGRQLWGEGLEDAPLARLALVADKEPGEGTHGGGFWEGDTWSGARNGGLGSWVRDIFGAYGGNIWCVT